MAQQILSKRSSVPAKVPTTAQLELGELAINTNDGKVFLKKNVSGVESIVEVGATSITGDVTGSGNSSITLTLANTGVTAGTYTKVTVDTKGRVTSAGTLAAADVPSLDWSKITSGKPTTVAGYGITDAIVSGGNYDFDIASNTNSSGYAAAAIEVRELNHAGAQTGVASEAPRISFHWGSRVASQIMIHTDASIQIRNNPGTGYEAFKAANIYTNDSLVPGINPATPKNGDIQVSGSTISIYASGAWRQIYPAVYS